MKKKVSILLLAIVLLLSAIPVLAENLSISYSAGTVNNYFNTSQQLQKNSNQVWLSFYLSPYEITYYDASGNTGTGYVRFWAAKQGGALFNETNYRDVRAGETRSISSMNAGSAEYVRIRIANTNMEGKTLRVKGSASGTVGTAY